VGLPDRHAVRPFNARSDRGGLVSGIFAKCRHTGEGARATLRRLTVSVAAIQRKADDLAREYRELDTRIQEADWLTTLSD
jgi:hypothetical protein